MRRTLRGPWAGLAFMLLAYGLLALAASIAQAQPASPSRNAVSPGWTRSVADGMEAFAPTQEAAALLQSLRIAP